MAKVRIKSGSEGPSHDPYGWTEVTFTRTDGLEVQFRYGGLGYERLLLDGVKHLESFGLMEGWDKSAAESAFEALAGFSPYEAERLVERQRRARWRRMSRREREQELAFEEADARLMSYAM